MFIVNRFVCFPSFLVQKGAGSSSFSPSLQRNHINELQLQAEFSTNTCVSLFEFCVVNTLQEIRFLAATFLQQHPNY
jgi:hypothetical protein